MKRAIFVGVVVLVVLGFVLGASWYRARRAENLGFMAQQNAATFVRPHSPTLGEEGARVYIVEFTDPACETCAAFSPVLKRFVANYRGQVKLVIRYAPLHEGSDAAVRILEAAKMQGKFWQTLELLYQNQNQWTQHHHVMPERIWPLLPQAGLDMARLQNEVNDPLVVAVIRQDLADGQALGVRKTPGIFVNGRPLEPFGLEPLVALVEDEVRKQYPE